MRISDWSSDVCSSDLPPQPLELPRIRRAAITQSGLTYRDPELRLFADIDIDTVRATGTRIDDDIGFSGRGTMRAQPFTLSGGLKSPNETIAGGKNALTLHAIGLGNTLDISGKYGRASCRERVCKYV